MRINVYAEEMTPDTEVVTRTVSDEEFGTRIFYGIRLYLDSPASLHHSEEDDDRSAITFWIKWTKAGGTDSSIAAQVFNDLLDLTMDLDDEHQPDDGE